MEIVIIENKKNKLTFELKGETHTFCNILKNELWNDPKVKVSAYRIKHPLKGTPVFTVETSGKAPVTALQDAVKRLKKSSTAFKKSIEKQL